MVGRLVSFWDGPFSGAMLVWGRVNFINHTKIPVHVANCILLDCHRVPGSSRMETDVKNTPVSVMDFKNVMDVREKVKSLAEDFGSWFESFFNFFRC